jgi:hypothetical protein
MSYQCVVIFFVPKYFVPINRKPAKFLSYKYITNNTEVVIDNFT